MEPPDLVLSDERLDAMSLDELTVLREQAADDVRTIQAALGGDYWSRGDARPMTHAEFENWRRRAKFALAKKQTLLARVNRRIKAKKEGHFEQRVLGSVRPAARALIRELCARYEFPGEDGAAMRRLVAALARVTLGDELPEVLSTVERWERAERAA